MRELLEHAVGEGRREIAFGETASYIPELGRVDKNQLGVCIYTSDGKKESVGDTDVRFTIQSISKVITLAVALERCGFYKVFEKVGMEPSGDAFNSLVKLDLSSNYPYNPMINSGAIAIASYLTPIISFKKMLEVTKKLCLDDQITLNTDVYLSEMGSISRNKAIAYLLESKGIIASGGVQESLDLYVRMCSLNVTAESLANFGLVLTLGGIHPETGERLLDEDVVRVVKTIMLTCGMYDGSGEFAVHVGVPSKSGVGGGILSVADKKMGIGIFGPALDSKGNSIAGRYILRSLSKELHLHMFA
ncbi:MAG: glutaminase A [Lachnospiraceae bacterium]